MGYIGRIIALSLAAIAISATQSIAQNRGGKSGKDPAVATVNGSTISYAWYERARLARLQQLSAGGDSATLSEGEDDAIFLSLIDAELIRTEAERRGIAVSRDQAIDLLVADPPGYMREMFTDQKGVLQTVKLRDVVRNPDRILNYVTSPTAPRQKILADWKADLEHLIRYYTFEELRRRLADDLYAGAPLTDADVEHRYYAEKTFLEGSVVTVLHSTVPDSLVPVSDQEARAWYEAHKEEYRIPESRLISSIILPVIPSSPDSAQHRAAIEAARKEIESIPVAERAKRVEKLSRGLPPNRVPAGRLLSPSEFTGEVRSDLAGASVGQLLGPYPVEDESLLLYVAGEVPSTDTLVRARHILLRVTAEMSKEEKEGLHRFAVALRDSIDSEDEFREAVRTFTDDNQSLEVEGDLGYMPAGSFVPEFDSAVFAAPVARPIGPVETRFGYHLIWVIDRSARSFSLREMRFPLRPSESVRREVSEDAERYAAALRTGNGIDSIIGALGAKYPGMVVDSGTILKRLDPYGDVLSTGEFVFQANVGEVGVLPLPYDRIAVIELHQIYHWEDGLPPYEDLAIYPIAHARRAKQLDTLERRLRDLASRMTSDMLLGPIREMAPMAEVYILNGQTIVQMSDEDPTLLDSLVAVTGIGEVTGPVRGKHGLYFLRVNERFGPTPEQYAREKNAYAEEYRRKYREDLLNDLILKARSYARVKDFRGKGGA